jgi:branched-chain amino acid transport system permease protein
MPGLQLFDLVRGSNWRIFACGWFLLIILGLLLNDFWINIATEALIMSLFTISFSLLFGYTGLLSFGQGAFLAVGAYGFSLALVRFNIPFPLCLAIGLAASGLWAWITGFICVSLRGIYFAIMTVVVTQSTFYIIFQWYDFTGGDNGIQGIFPPKILCTPLYYYYFTLVVVTGAFFIFYRIISSPFGLSLMCIRENATRCLFVGVKVRRHIHKAFVMSGLFAGLAGILLAPFTRFVAPQMADWLSSSNPLFMGILGGVTNIWGPVLGAIAWVCLDAFVTGFTEHWPLIIGVILFVIIFFMPGGLTGLIGAWLKKSKA